jgi:hypothetical protein
MRPPPWNALRGIAAARGWRWADRWALLRTAHAWQRSGFACEAQDTVADLCHALPQGLKDSFIDPLCVAALNTPADQASGQVFLRVLQDSLFGGRGSSDLLLPRQDLGQVFPQAALEWLQAHGALVRLGQRVQSLGAAPQGSGWLVDGVPFDAVLLATPSTEAARLVSQCAHTAPLCLDRCAVRLGRQCPGPALRGHHHRLSAGRTRRRGAHPAPAHAGFAQQPTGTCAVCL